MSITADVILNILCGRQSTSLPTAYIPLGRDRVAQVPDLFEVGFPRAGVVKRGSMPPSLALQALAQAFARGEIWLHVLDALAADDIDTDCNGVITMADRPSP